MASSAAINRGSTAAAGVPSHMGRDAADAQISHKLPGVLALVGSEGFLMRTLEGSGHPDRGFSLSSACGLTDFAGHHQSIAVLHDAMAHEAQIGTHTRSLFEQTGLSIAGGTVGLVREQQPAEVAFGALLATGSATAKSVATTGRWRSVVQTINALQRAVGGPSPQQGAIHGEVL